MTDEMKQELLRKLTARATLLYEGRGSKPVANIVTKSSLEKIFKLIGEPEEPLDEIKVDKSGYKRLQLNEDMYMFFYSSKGEGDPILSLNFVAPLTRVDVAKPDKEQDALRAKHQELAFTIDQLFKVFGVKDYLGEYGGSKIVPGEYYEFPIFTINGAGKDERKELPEVLMEVLRASVNRVVEEKKRGPQQPAARR